MRRVVALLLAASLGGGLVPAVSASVTDHAITGLDARVLAPEASTTPPGMVTAIVTMRSQADLRPAARLNRNARQVAVIRALRDHAGTAQVGLRAFLGSQAALGRVARSSSFWVFNGMSVTATPAVIAAIAARPDVLRVEPDEVPIVPMGTVARLDAAPATPTAPTTAEPNVALVDAPALWALGYTGQGVVVANLDSGVDVTHPDLAGRWRGGTNSWFDPYGQHPATPTDLTGHGTSTMGVMVGGDAGGTSIGVAPGATWIAAKIFSDSGTATATAIHSAFQWVLDPDGNPATADAPQVVNNSWAYGSPGCNLAFQPDLQALVAANIVPVFAAGNYGPGASSSVSPANYPEALAVGATNNSSVVDATSSRGPSACGEPSTTYPDVVAPGVKIRAADLLGMYQVATGTSLAAPHVSGAIALLLSSHPGLTATEEAAALVSSATDLGPTGPDSTYGHGEIDGLAAYGAVAPTPTPNPTPTPMPTPTPTPTPTPMPTPTPPPTPDTVGPVVTGAASSVATSLGAASVTISATATDPVSPGGPSAVVAGESFEGADPGPGLASALSAADGSFGSSTEALSGSVPTAGLSYGEHLRWARARDAAGNWGSVVPILLTITPADAIFANGFEGGTTGGWSANSGGTRLIITNEAASGGSYGLTVATAATGAAYVADTSPAAETVYRARFTFAAHGATTPSGATIDLFAGLSSTGARLFTLQYRRTTAGLPQVRASVTRKGGTSTTAWVSITDAPTAIELVWTAAKAASFRLNVGGSVVASVSSIDTSTYRLEEVRLGAVAGTTAGTLGTFYLDRFVSARATPLGS